MRLVIVTDAWMPQVNGVVTVLRALVRELSLLGVETTVLHPGCGPTVALPGYAEIRVSGTPWRVGQWLRDARPDAVHIATEGPLGFAARRWLCAAGWRFTTAMHSKFPEYLALRTGLSPRLGYALLRRFHAPSSQLLVQTDSQRRELQARGFGDMAVVGGGVDTQRFRPLPRERPGGALFVGRVAVEKGLPAFLSLDLPVRKVVVGDGPAREALQSRFPEVEFRGFLHGDALVQAYSDADVLVFPSRTDTFGLVLLEALACGTPVAAFPVTGPVDLVEEGSSGALDDDLGQAVLRALGMRGEDCRRRAEAFRWADVAQRFLGLQVPVRRADAGRTPARAAA
jgi:glycosyltransferase involved in cell wall biosynthesis